MSAECSLAGAYRPRDPRNQLLRTSEEELRFELAAGAGGDVQEAQVLDVGCHVFSCPDCDHVRVVPQSCKSRLCPTCGQQATDLG